MLDFSNFLDLPLIWALLIATAVFLYVILDGFDLGVGILFPFAPSDKCRDKMMNSVVPFWDGNETWLVLGGGGLLAAFPLAYSILLPAFYIPIIMMLLGLILRGVAFEFRFKASRSRKIWDIAFHFGSLTAAFFQGVVLGAFIDGVEVYERSFAGEKFDWATGFSFVTGIAVVLGYSLLGSTWLILKTEDKTQSWATRSAIYSIYGVSIMMVIVTIRMLFISDDIYSLWLKYQNLPYTIALAILCIVCVLTIIHDVNRYTRSHTYEVRPFIMSALLFLLCYIALCITMYPWIVPFQVSIWDAAAYAPSLSLMLIGAVFLLPIILGYVGYSYYIFRGKSSEAPMY